MKKQNLFKNIEDFKKELYINEKLELDDKDNYIISALQNKPDTSQDEIAGKIKLSQPSVGARIRKLETKGLLSNVQGVNFRKVKLQLAKIDITTTDTAGLIEDFKDCPFFINAFVTSGRFNLTLLMMATDLKRLEGITNYHLRSNEKVKDIEMNIVISTAKDFVHPLNIDYNDMKACCDQKCRDFAEKL